MNYFIQSIPILLTLAIYGLRMMEVASKREVVRGPVQEKTTFRLFMVSGLIAVLGGIAEHVLRHFPFNWIWIGLGVVFAIASFLIRRSTIAALGQFWSLHIEIRDNHQFVQSGPFRWMRHPTYFSMVLEILSVTLILGSFVSGAIAFLIFVPALYRRISAEEKAMVGKFGEEYQTYQRKTPMLFPLKAP